MDTGTVIYIASGKQYLDEAQASARSLPAGTPYLILSPELVFNYWYLNSTACLVGIFDAPALARYDRFLLLDTDTYICGDIGDFFTILDRFDIAGTHAVARETQVHRGDIPASFPELHIGAISFRRNERVKELFKLWLEIYQGNPAYFGDNDQGPLREALWKMPEIKLGILPSEFCFRYRWGGLVSGPVRVLHGRRNGTPYEQIAREVNGKGIRVYGRRELA